MANGKWRSIMAIILVALVFIALVPEIVLAGPPPVGSGSWDWMGSWDCLWWARFYGLIADLTNLLTV